MELDNHIDHANCLIEEIFDALGLDAQAQKDAVKNTVKFAGFHKAVELRTWTSNASQQQVLWHFLAYSYRSEEHTSELQSLMRISYAVFCLKKNNNENNPDHNNKTSVRISHY